MKSKLEIRKMITEGKSLYLRYGDKSFLIEIAILKGAYLAVGGEKGIPLSSKLDFITNCSKIIFTYKNKADKAKNNSKAIDYLINNTGSYGSNVKLLINNNMIKSNTELAELLTEMILYNYTEDMIINRQTLLNKTLNIINILD